MKKNNLLSNFPNIVDKYWDYEKNTDNPEDISLDSEKKYYWKDTTGSFQLSPMELIKKDSGTSFNEQAIYFYCKKYFKQVFNRYKYKTEKKVIEVDIYIPEIRLAIEYDGVFWHKNKYDKDIEKNRILFNEGVYILRIREKDLQKIEGEKSKSIMYDFEEDFSNIINKVFDFIKQHINNLNYSINDEALQNILNFHLSKETFEADKIKILNQYRTTYVENNITNTCLMKFWDYDKNRHIIPQKIAPTDNIKIWFKCAYGFNKAITVSSVQTSHRIQCLQVNEQTCISCQKYYCPFVNYCGAEINNRNRDFNSVICNKLMKFYFHQILNEKIDLNQAFKEYNDDCIDDSQTYYDCDNIYTFYYKYRQKIMQSANALSKLKKIFGYINLTPKYSKNLEELSDFLTNTQLYIHKINYLDFDNNDTYIKWLIHFLKESIIKDRRYDLLEIPMVDQHAVSKELILELYSLVKELQRKNRYTIYQYLLKQYEKLLENF